MKRPTDIGTYIIPLGLLAILGTVVLLAAHHMPHSIWNDEGLTIDIVRTGQWTDIVRGSMTRKPFPPLFFFLTYAGMQLFEGHLGLRLASLLFGLLAVIAVYWLGKTLLGRWCGLAAAALLASTPGVFFHFVDANPYTIMIFWSALSLGLLAKALEKDRMGRWAAYSLAALGGLASHTLFIFVLAGQWLYYVHAQWSKSERQRPQSLLRVDFWKQQRRFLLSVGIILLCWVSWVSFYFLSKGFSAQAGQLFSVSTLFSLIGLIPAPFTYALWPHGVISVLLILCGLIRLLKFNPQVLVGLLLAWIPPVVGIVLFVKLTLPFISYRYGLGVFPITCLIAAAILLPSPGRPSKKHVLGPALLSLCILLGIAKMALAPSNYFAYCDWTGCNKYLTQAVKPQDQIWFEYDERSFPLQYYYPNRSQIVFCPGRGIDDEVRDLSVRFQHMANSEGRIWLVFSSFSNRFSWVERLTRTESKTNREDINRRLQERYGLRLQQDRAFDRVSVYQLQKINGSSTGPGM